MNEIGDNRMLLGEIRQGKKEEKSERILVRNEIRLKFKEVWSGHRH